MIKAITSTVAEEGRLLLVAHKKGEDFKCPPWPLTVEEIDLFKIEGLTELSHEIHTEKSKISNTRFRVLYSKKNRYLQ